MVTLADLFDPALLSLMVREGYVRVQQHPSAPLVIHNYTEKAQYESVWNEVTLTCRGLISAPDGTIVARPYPKFFNHGQPGAPELGLAARARDGREGLVVWFPETDVRVKLKYEEYVRLHRIVTGLSARTVWERIDELDALVESLPDEFHGWVKAVAAELHAEVDEQLAAIEDAYLSIVDGLPEDWSRKDFALVAGRHPLRAGLFMRLDGKDCRTALWQRIRPAGDWTPSGRVMSEDTA